MKGIILAGGAGTRLYPATKIISKQILPVYDKPMIYYPLSLLMTIGINEILVISTPRDINDFKELLLDGKQLGINISYAIQYEPKGIAEAFIVGKEFIGKDSVVLILGDNIFLGQDIESVLDVTHIEGGATILGYYEDNPSEFGVVEFDINNKVISIEEKPIVPKSNYIVPGLYFYDNNVIEIVKNIKPSKRGELEITEVNNEYLRQGKLIVKIVDNRIKWIDTGTHKSMLNAALLVEEYQREKGIYIGCIEEIAYNKGYIIKKEFNKLVDELPNTEYKSYLNKLCNEV